ncbi:hypothetical protein, partial [Escherichia coli]|uniref:hypothetical protein n=1 Tax=Escherichia coli TaxID=562 RepID=UPI0019688253
IIGADKVNGDHSLLTTSGVLSLVGDLIFPFCFGSSLIPSTPSASYNTSAHSRAGRIVGCA